MANIVLDFLHNYQTGERRESEPANAYQYDEGHVLEAVLPEVITSCEIHYWIRGMETADAYVPTSITPNGDNSCTVLGNIPNKYFETNGELRVYIVVNDESASITTYEGKLHICQRSMPDDYVDDDPENEATRILAEAQAAATTATQQAQAASDSAGQAQQSAETLSGSVAQIATNTQNITQLQADTNTLKEELTHNEADVLRLNYSALPSFGVSAERGDYDAVGFIDSTTRAYYYGLTTGIAKISVKSGCQFIVGVKNTPIPGTFTTLSLAWTTNEADLSAYQGMYLLVRGRRTDNGTITDLDLEDMFVFHSFDDNLTDTVADIKETTDDMKELYKQYLGVNKYRFPSGFNMTSPVNVYTDGFRFFTDFNADEHKNTSANTWYVKPSGGTGDCTTRAKAGQFATAYNHASAGDTIIMLEGFYNRTLGGYRMIAIGKSLNIIGEGSGAVILDGDYITFTKLSGYDHVYSGTRGSASRCIDTSIEGKYIPYTGMTSIDDVESTAGSYYISGSTVYVHSLDGTDPSSHVCVCVNYEPAFDISNADASVKVYVENITIVGKYKGITINKASTTNDLEVCFNNFTAMLCGGGTYNAFNVYGGDVIFNKCKALSAYRDGFNYNGVNKAGTTCAGHFTEIDCVGAGCGHGGSDDTMNGSTAHQGSKVIRINGTYYDNQGASVADVQADTQSVNLGCKAYAPYCTSGYSQNFSAQQSGTDMWLDSCLAVGGKYDIFCADNSTVIANNTAYVTKSIYSSGTFTETHKREITELMLLQGVAFAV